MRKLEEEDYLLLSGVVEVTRPSRTERAKQTPRRPDRYFVTCQAELFFEDDPSAYMHYPGGKCKSYANVYVEGMALCRTHAIRGTVTGDLVEVVWVGKYDKSRWSR